MGRCSQCRSQSATGEEEEKEDRHPSPAAGREGEPPTAGFYQDSCRAWRHHYRAITISNLLRLFITKLIIMPDIMVHTVGKMLFHTDYNSSCSDAAIILS